MKRSFYLLMLAAAGLVSCDKDFLQRDPKTSLTEETFFKSVSDLETYSNGFYNFIGANYSDIFSDNISLNTGSSETDNMIRGGISASTVGGWNNWGDLRRINLLLKNVGQASGDPTQIRHFTGIARFFRGMFYYEMVKRYGDVPWYSTVLGTGDEKLLYKAKDPRTVVVDSVMKDLEYAAANIQASGTNTRVTRWAALTLLARTALHEGTYRKYHTELNLQGSAQAFLERAASASQTLMTDGGFSVAPDYRSVFVSNNLDANKEVIFLQKNSQSNGIANNTHTVLDWQWALSGQLADEFLMADGTPYTSQPGYGTKSFVDMFKNRDPRLAETIMPPGFSTTPSTGAPYLIKPGFGGLLQVKFYPRDPSLRGGWNLNYTDLPIFRYAEVLLVNAEAKAELGTLTQTDLDKTINLLRTRVGMPKLDLATANATPDPYLAAAYPAVTGTGKGVILEIRRERRVELACEGFRYDDVFRWKAGKLLEKAGRGIYVAALGALDVTGDGVADIAILEAQGKEEPLASVPDAIRSKLVKYYLTEGSFYLENGTSGKILFTKDKSQPRQFIEPKYYARPIPLQQLVLNPNLTQPAGWE